MLLNCLARHTHTHTLTHLLCCQLLFHTDVHDIKGIRSYDGRVHVAIVEQVANDFKNVILRSLRELLVQQEAKLHSNVSHGISVEGAVCV